MVLLLRKIYAKIRVGQRLILLFSSTPEQPELKPRERRETPMVSLNLRSLKTVLPEDEVLHQQMSVTAVRKQLCLGEVVERDASKILLLDWPVQDT